VPEQQARTASGPVLFLLLFSKIEFPSKITEKFPQKKWSAIYGKG
jgi:hypothetical protein